MIFYIDPYTQMMTKRKIIAGDVGGSHLTAALFEEQDGVFSLIDQQRIAVDSTLSKSSILSKWSTVFTDYFNLGEHVFLALAMPAPFDYSNGICLIQDQNKFQSLYQVNLKEEISKSTGIATSDIKFVNDAQAFLSGEAFFGLGRGMDKILGITLGSGLGSAIKIGDKVTDADLWNSEFKDSIAEDYLGTEWFIKFARHQWNLHLNGVKGILEPEHIEKRNYIFNHFAKNLSDFIALQYHRIKMDQVIIGGNISLAHHLFLDKTLFHLKNQNISIPIAISEFGEKSALFGAASTFLDRNDLVGL